MSIKDIIPKFRKTQDAVAVTRPERGPVEDFQRQVNRLFDEFFSDFPVVTGWGAGGVGFYPRVDIHEGDKEVTVSAELPGMDEKDIAVELHDGMLTIKGERKDEWKGERGRFSVQEQSYGVFRRTFPLPAGIQADKVTAKFKKGVLQVTIPRKPEQVGERKVVEIEAA